MLVAVLLSRDKLQLDTSWAKKEAGKFTIDDHNKRDYYTAMVELENTNFHNHTQRSDWERMLTASPLKSRNRFNQPLCKPCNMFKMCQPSLEFIY